MIGLELAKMPIIALNTQLKAQSKTPIGVKWANDLGLSTAKQDLGFDLNDNSLIAFNKLQHLIEPYG